MSNLNPNKWSDSLQPKTQNRWILNIDGIPTFLIRTTGRPKMTNDEFEMPYINNTSYFKGLSKWETMDITLVDSIETAASKALMDWLLLHHDQATGVDGYKAEYTKNVTLKLISPLGTTIEEWSLKNVWMTNIDLGSLDYTSGDPIEISLTLRFDDAKLTSVVF